MTEPDPITDEEIDAWIEMRELEKRVEHKKEYHEQNTVAAHRDFVRKYKRYLRDCKRLNDGPHSPVPPGFWNDE